MQTRGKTRRAKEAQQAEARREAKADRSDDEEIEEEEEEGTRFDGEEIAEGVFCGGEGCALDSEGRRARGITHVVSVSSNFEQRKPPETKMVASGHWLHFSRENRPTANMLNILDDAVAFIDRVKKKKGKVCVVSLEGASRAATVCVAYLIKSHRLTLRAATMRMTAKAPRTNINRGFWRQLVVYEEYVHGMASMTEDDLPGAILFEKDELDAIASSFRESKRRARLAEPMSPTTATGFGALSLVSGDTKRKSTNRAWNGNIDDIENDNDDDGWHRIKSPRASIDHADPTLETKS
ncbi:Dual specificity protein phosphatase, putative [Hondaea fermentalgiana]|uniref:protein-tyrosine-phosphatase n=1 Tax=Hondaea fermentalgiana TaxID=2315210 RepID=A0A2R5GDN1_9STRA|nr:Dual specificity protein phosphatase, putative [Hondaea fermentalgiana]|eukprot:GBG28419.1 Dual specificity protein phosphatase, putative [Hondaea fermentalgiana]